MRQPVYFDHHATTPVDERVFEEMKPYFCQEFGNTGSVHCFGKSVKQACEQARDAVADAFGAKNPAEVVFTSGATESNNLALKGVAYGYASKGRHIITTKVEHPSVLATCQFLQTQGYEVTYLPVDQYGAVSANEIAQAIRNGIPGTTDRTILVSVIAANNEIGTINPIQEIAAVCRSADVLLHVDGAQAVGKIPFEASAWGVDFVSMSGHKIYGPKGIGAFYINSERAPYQLVPLMHGGGQEFGIRSGTLPVSLVVGLGKACAIACEEMDKDSIHQSELRHFLISELRRHNIEFSLNGHPERRLPGNASISFAHIESELLALGFKNIAVSSTSACSAGKAKASHVLTAIGLTPDQAMSTVRFGFGRQNTEADVAEAVEQIAANYRKFSEPPLRRGGPDGSGRDLSES
jgi:cysteine desulfurase